MKNNIMHKLQTKLESTEILEIGFLCFYLLIHVIKNEGLETELTMSKNVILRKMHLKFQSQLEFQKF